MIKIIIIMIIVGVNCFMMGYQYRGYREEKFVIKELEELIKDLEELNDKRTHIK